ncbi:hypothetical protein D3C73_1020150 [compost metagenome]
MVAVIGILFNIPAQQRIGGNDYVDALAMLNSTNPISLAAVCDNCDDVGSKFFELIPPVIHQGRRCDNKSRQLLLSDFR